MQPMRPVQPCHLKYWRPCPHAENVIDREKNRYTNSYAIISVCRKEKCGQNSQLLISMSYVLECGQFSKFKRTESVSVSANKPVRWSSNQVLDVSGRGTSTENIISSGWLLIKKAKVEWGNEILTWQRPRSNTGSVGGNEIGDITSQGKITHEYKKHFSQGPRTTL